MNIKITGGEIIRLKIPLVKPFVTSFGSMEDREIILFSLTDDEGKQGFGEAPVLSLPLYNAEIPESAIGVLSRIIFPLLKKREFSHPDQLDEACAFIKGNEFAKSAAIMALYDLFGNKMQQRVVDMLGGKRSTLIMSATISIHDSMQGVLEESSAYYQQGIRYLKLKVKPGYDYAYAAAIKKKFPDVKLMLDANSSYALSPETSELFKRCDDLGLYCIEQPLQSFDIIDHAKLQAVLKTDIALDESIESIYDVTKALELKSCRLVNIKIARVGGFTQAMAINKFCMECTIKTWVGGMLESPVGFYANLALAAQENFDYPIDFLGALTYMQDYENFFAVKPFEIKGDRLILKITKPGLGLDLNWDVLNKYAVERIPLS